MHSDGKNMTTTAYPKNRLVVGAVSCLRAWLETYRRVFRPGTRRRAQLAGPWASVGGVDVLVVQGPGQRGDPAAALVAPTHERAAGDGIFEWWAT
jgi:hypothetical protein